LENVAERWSSYMKFLLVDQGAAEEIVSDRYLQSTEFEPGRSLGALLSGAAKKNLLNPRLHLFEKEDGIYILSRSSEIGNVLVVDEVAAKVFYDRSESEALVIIQKLARFAVRYWKKLRPNRNETYILNSSKAVVFPFPISNQTSYRIVVEREPDQKRLERRSKAQFLLAYRSGTGEGLGAAEEAPLTEFRRALKYLEVLRGEVASSERAQAETAEIDSLRVTALASDLHTVLPPQQGFDRWLALVTGSQKTFIEQSLTTPHRIEGPAGTGKTLALILKCIAGLRNAAKHGLEHRALFVAHSEATRKTIQDLFLANDVENFSSRDRYTDKQSLQVTTLHELCGQLLNTEISESEFLDRDAMESKNAQLLYVSEAVCEVLARDLETHRRFLSGDLAKFLTEEEEWTVSEMVQHEISVLIKGRADEELDKYRRMPFLSYGLPIRSDADRGFVFIIFLAYQEKLRASAQFDTDDIVLTAIGQLNTPIWRRRRQREGYDGIFIDETHLFNMNELSVFHYLSRSESIYPIAYSVDRSQSLGDRGWSNEAVESALGDGMTGDKASRTVMKSIFRSSPEIVNLAFSVTSSGATLFTNFENPLTFASSTFTVEEERYCAPPTYFSYTHDDGMISGAFDHAERMVQDVEGSKHDILIVAFDPTILEALVRYAEDTNKPIEVISQRGDNEVVKRAQRAGRFVVGLADYVGGLEFSGVVLVGVDGGRLPPTRTQATSESSNFLSYASHGRLYVAIMRAKYRVDILGTNQRGPSRLLVPAFNSGALLNDHVT
jgi:UvrD/REP helicase N-terminal domain